MDISTRPVDTVVVSLNFTPGHYSHLAATCCLLQASGHEPAMYVHERFNTMDSAGRWPKVNSSEDLERLTALRAAVFWSPSLKNIGAMRALRRRGVRIVYVLHEPFDSIASYRRGGFGWPKVAKIVLASLAQARMVRLAHAVVLPSDKSLALYEKRYRWLNSRFARIPLLFDDEAEGADLSADAKDTVSYIGTAAEDHAFDDFLRFVEHAVEHGLLPGLRFSVVTRSVLTPSQQHILERLAAGGRVSVQSGTPLPNEVINEAYRRSLVVWNAYRRTNQSGVLPKAYMFGAAVLTTAGLPNEFVDLGRTAEEVDGRRPDAVAAAVERIRERRLQSVRASRERFLETFHQRRHASALLALLGLAPAATAAP
jgi:glycosyltransferase involved in cell wall biosynthesis